MTRHLRKFPRRLRARRCAAATCVGLTLLFAGLNVPSAYADFGFLPGASGFSVTATNEDGSIDNQAGSHPYAITTSVNFNLAPEDPSQPGGPFTDGDLRDLHLELPPGLIENPGVLQQCTLAQFHTSRSSPFEAPSLSGESCPNASQIGVFSIHSSFAGGSIRHFGLFNLVPPPGAPSQFGASPFGVPITFTPHIRQTGGEYGLTLNSTGFPQLFDLYGFELTTWGTPWVISHDDERGNCLNEVDPASPFGVPASTKSGYHSGTCSIGNPAFFPPKPYLTLPSSCTGPLATRIEADSYQQPTPVDETYLSRDAEGDPRGLEGCGALAIGTLGTAVPSTERTSTPTGFNFSLETNENGLLDPQGRAQSQIKKTVVTLPEGMTINPSVAAGLGVCTPAQYAAETLTSAPGAGCPNASKIGDITVQSPLFEETVSGSLFLAQPDDPATATPGAENPFDSLLALYIVAKAPERGVLVKVAGKVEPDLHTGRLLATFDDLPQLPYSHFSVQFRNSQRSLLITPPACGDYLTPIELTSWPAPDSILHDVSSFRLKEGIGGGGCPGPVPPFSPQAQAGTLNSNAGSYTPFYLHLTRRDGEAEVTSYSAKLPPGLLGKLAGIPYCPEIDIEAAKRERGVAEEQHPSCPSASEIGHTVAGYGVGSSLTYAPGKLYLAGPFHGSPFSVVAIDSATVGPFDLGVIVIRSAIKVNPQTAQVSIDSAGSDPIPHILDGIPLNLRDIRVYISKPGFTVNPTSCNALSVTSSLSGSAAPFTNPATATAIATAPFQVSNCSALGFAPKLSLHLKGGTRRGDYPALTATVTPRSGDANIGSAAVTLPASEFLEQGHIGTVCTKTQLEREACPAGSAYGHAAATTPLLAEPMTGPIYLATGFGTKLPELVAALHGQGLTIDVDGRIDSVHGGLRGTFEGLPDAPVSKFVFSLNGGKKGLLVNERNVCTSPETATARFVGQDNKGELLKPKLEAKCGKQGKGSSSHKNHRPSKAGH